jgi:hypothetical protein
MKKSTIYQVTLFSIFGIFLFLFIVYDVMRFNENVKKNSYLPNQLDKEDSLFFKSNIIKHFVVKEVIKNEYREKLKYFEYKKLYNFYYTKIPLKKYIPIDQFINFKEKVSEKTSGETYTFLTSTADYDVGFRIAKLEPIIKIFFSMTGEMDEMRRTVYTKDLVSYYLPLYSFSLRYEDEDNPVDILVEEKKSNIFNREGFPFVISFYKKQNFLYVFLISPIDKNTPINEQIISELVQY